MLPSKIPVRSRPVRSFDLITPQGQTYRFPQPTLLQRLLRWGLAHAETLALIYVAGFVAEALDHSVFDACNDRVGLRRVG
jgi:acyl-coenzyme A synthetase/AMP-(fatty) acid ligase